MSPNSQQSNTDAVNNDLINNYLTQYHKNTATCQLIEKSPSKGNKTMTLCYSHKPEEEVEKFIIKHSSSNKVHTECSSAFVVSKIFL